MINVKFDVTINAKPDEPAKPEEEQKPEAVQPTPETREQSLEY